MQRWFKKIANHPFQVGVAVVVKEGIKEADTGLDMSGWQGRVSEVDATNDLIMINWDSITLRALPPAYIENSEETGYRWDQYLLPPAEVEPATVRDTEADVKTTVAALGEQYRWAALGPEGKAIQAILKHITADDEPAAMRAWEKHLRKTLRFPFKAVIAEFQPVGRLQSGDQVTARKITDIDERYGLLVEIQSRHGMGIFPLCDLEVAHQKSSNYEQLKNYTVWYANR